MSARKTTGEGRRRISSVAFAAGLLIAGFALYSATGLPTIRFGPHGSSAGEQAPLAFPTAFHLGVDHRPVAVTWTGGRTGVLVHAHAARAHRIGAPGAVAPPGRAAAPAGGAPKPRLATAPADRTLDSGDTQDRGPAPPQPPPPTPTTAAAPAASPPPDPPPPTTTTVPLPLPPVPAVPVPPPPTLPSLPTLPPPPTVPTVTTPPVPPVPATGVDVPLPGSN